MLFFGPISIHVCALIRFELDAERWAMLGSLCFGFPRMLTVLGPVQPQCVCKPAKEFLLIVVGSVETLSSWISGCSCHPPETHQKGAPAALQVNGAQFETAARTSDSLMM